MTNFFDKDDQRFQAEDDMDEHLRACEDCTLARHGRSRQCRQGFSIEQRLRKFGGVMPKIENPIAKPVSSAGVINRAGAFIEPNPSTLDLNVPLTRQGVRDLSFIGPARFRNRRAVPPCARALAPHSFLAGSCKECGVSDADHSAFIYGTPGSKEPDTRMSEALKNHFPSTR